MIEEYDTKLADTKFTEQLINETTHSIESYFSELNSEDILIQSQGSATPGDTCVNELGVHQISATPGESCVMRYIYIYIFFIYLNLHKGEK